GGPGAGRGVVRAARDGRAPGGTGAAAQRDPGRRVGRRLSPLPGRRADLALAPRAGCREGDRRRRRPAGQMKSAPLWLDAGALAGIEFPAGETVDADVAVVGGGLTGLSAAYHLAAARPGARVVLLEADNLGGGASGRNTGMLGPGVGQSLPALAQRLGREPAAALYRSTLEAVSDVRSLCGRE